MKKGSQEFDNILNECLEQLLVRGEDIERCLTRYPEQAAELEPLLQTAVQVKKATAIQPRPEFKARARYQFQSVLREAESKRNRPFFSWRPQWAMVTAIILVIVLAGGGTVATASNSMPDEALYPVRLATEQVRLTLTPSKIGKAELYTKFADKRVLEIARMAQEGKPAQVEQASQRLDAYMAKLVNLASVQEEKAEVLLAPSPRQATEPPAPAGVEPAPDKTSIKQAKLKTLVISNAIRHQARLRDALKTAPESVRPGLQRAIAASDKRYQEALQALD